MLREEERGGIDFQRMMLQPTLFRLDVLMIWAVNYGWRLGSVSLREDNKKAPVSRFPSTSVSHTSPRLEKERRCICVWMYINMVANKITGHGWMDDAEKERCICFKKLCLRITLSNPHKPTAFQKPGFCYLVGLLNRALCSLFSPIWLVWL